MMFEYKTLKVATMIIYKSKDDHTIKAKKVEELEIST